MKRGRSGPGLADSLLSTENILFAALIALHVHLIWAHPFVPTQDGPVAVGNGHILRQWLQPSAGLYHEYLTINPRADPNWTVHIALGALMFVFSPPVAEKILLSVYAVLLPVSVLFAVRAVRPEAGFLAVLAFPFTFSYMYHLGFYNFVLSLPLFFFVVGGWMKRGGCLTPREAASLAIQAALLYFCHVLTLLLAIAAVGILAAGFSISDALASQEAPETPARVFLGRLGRRALGAVLVFAPASALALLFLAGQTGREWMGHLGFGLLIGRLVHLDSLVSHTTPEIFAAAGVAFLFAALLAWHLGVKILRRRADRWDWLLAVVALYLAAFFLAPEATSGGRFISGRLNLFPFLALILWFAAQPHGRALRAGVQAAAAFAAVVFLTFHSAGYKRIDAALEEYLSASTVIPSNSTILPLCYDPFGHSPEGRPLSSRISVFLHAAGLVAAERDALDLDNYQANAGYFPTVWRPERNPFVFLPTVPDGLESNPPCVDILAYPAKTGGRVDYVLTWGSIGGEGGDACAGATARQLAERYDLIHTSAPRGLMKVYRRKDLAPGRIS